MGKEYTALVQVSNADAPRELFQDRQALRRDYQSAKNSNSLDVLMRGPNASLRLPGPAIRTLPSIQ